MKNIGQKKRRGEEEEGRGGERGEGEKGRGGDDDADAEKLRGGLC